MSDLIKVCEDWFPDTKGFWMDSKLKQQIDIALKNVVHDWDFVIVITGGGEVRVGKSVLGLQICTYWTYELEKMHKIKVPFDIKKNIIFQWSKLIEQGNGIGVTYPYSAIQYDEAGETMEGTKSATMELKAVRDFLRECGQYNFLTVLVMPEFFDLPKGIALTRSTFLLDVYYTSDQEGLFRRGYFRFYSKKQKKKLYLYGKKELNYAAAPYNFDGEFKNFYPINEQDYRKTKQEALKDRETANRDTRLMTLQSLLFMLFQLGYSVRKIHKEVEMLNRGTRMPAERTFDKWIHQMKIEKPNYEPFV